MKPILYGNTISPFVRKVKVVLLEKGIDHEGVDVNPFKPDPEFQKKSPLGKIPVFQDAEGRVINDSSVIAAYIEERYPQNPLFPADLYERARARWFEEYMDTEMAAKLIFTIFRERVLAPLFLKQESNQSQLEAGLQAAPKILGYLESQLDGKPFFAGNALSIADISIASAFCNLRYAQFGVDQTQYPGLAKWLNSMHSRPAFAGLIAGEEGFLNKLRDRK